jgi:phosphomannomutase
MEGFKAYDIRGIYNQDFNKEDVYRIGHFLPSLFDGDRFVVGRDHRNSSEEVHEYLIKGLLSAGVDVYDIGLATTPMLYYAAGKHGFPASVQITASHNPPEYNGFKISGRDVMPVGYANGLNRLEELVHHGKVTSSEKQGKKIPLDIREDYLQFLKGYINPAIHGLNLAVDASNGMAGYIVKDILGETPHYLYEQPDGNFPNHDPNPLKAENQQPLKDLVLGEGCDAGILFDGDADRVIFIDEKGRFVSPDLVIALMGHFFLKKPGERVLQDIRSSQSVKEYLASFEADVRTWKVGRAFACPMLKEIDGIYGGEFAGHFYFRDFYYADSAMLATIVVLNVLAGFKDQGISFSDLIARISKYHSSGELNYTIGNKQEAMDRVVRYFAEQEEPLESFDFDGLRMDFPDWWFNIRPSNTEPYLRLIVEANDPGLLDDKVKEIEKILLQYQ